MSLVTNMSMIIAWECRTVILFTVLLVGIITKMPRYVQKIHPQGGLLAKSARRAATRQSAFSEVVEKRAVEVRRRFRSPSKPDGAPHNFEKALVPSKAMNKILLPSILLLANCAVVAEAQLGLGLGNPAKLKNNGDPKLLNTGRGKETAEQKAHRMAGKVPIVDPIEAPDPNIGPFDQDGGPYIDPLKKAKCINEAYDPGAPNSTMLYEDYKQIFMWGFHNDMGPPIKSASLGNNKVTNNRLPSMFTRMCFHDNSIDSSIQIPFNEYVKNHLKKGKWKGPTRYLETSGADASVLICPEERYHPNQNYDQTASRVLYALQSADTGILDDTTDTAISMVDKYGLSYADLLHNGCVAAAIFLTQVEKEDLDTVFKFGRKDACHLPAGRKNAQGKFGPVFSLCGPTENLPGVSMEADELSNWFYDRGMNECTWLALMWTHTVMVRNVSSFVAFTLLVNSFSYLLFSMLLILQL